MEITIDYNKILSEIEESRKKSYEVKEDFHNKLKEISEEDELFYDDIKRKIEHLTQEKDNTIVEVIDVIKGIGLLNDELFKYIKENRDNEALEDNVLLIKEEIINNKKVIENLLGKENIEGYLLGNGKILTTSAINKITRDLIDITFPQILDIKDITEEKYKKYKKDDREIQREHYKNYENSFNIITNMIITQQIELYKSKKITDVKSGILKNLDNIICIVGDKYNCNVRDLKHNIKIEKIYKSLGEKLDEEMSTSPEMTFKNK